MATEVGIRELRNHTTAVIETVRSGETVYLTKRGVRVAEIRPIEQPRLIDRLMERAAKASRRDTGAFEELLGAKQADIEAQNAKDGRLWR